MTITHPNDLIGLADLIITLMEIIVLTAITSVFWRNYNESKSNFTLGLLFFAILILINQLVYLASFIIDSAYFYFIIDLLGLIGFIILLKLVLK